MGNIISLVWALSDGLQRQDQEPDEYDVMTVEEINKIQLGKLIIKYCGHEGTTDNEQTASLRKLLQRAITNLEPQQEQYPGVWRDAELKIFDLYGNGYVVKSGQGSVKFVAQITGKGDVELSKIKDESCWTSMKALFKRQDTQQLQIEGAPPEQSNANQSWLSSFFSFWPSTSGSQPREGQVEGVSQMVPGSLGEDGDGTPHGEHQVKGVTSMVTDSHSADGDGKPHGQYQIEAVSPMVPGNNGEDGDGTPHGKHQVVGVSPMVPGSPGEDGDGTPHGKHQDHSFSGQEQGGGSQNNSSSSSSFNLINPQPADNLSDSESQTGGNDLSGSASQVQIQPTEANGGSQSDKKEDGGKASNSC